MADYKKIVSVMKNRTKGLSAQGFSTQETGCDLGSSYNEFLKKEVKNNKSFGIDWDTFKVYADEYGYYATCENFKTMPDTIYNVLFKLTIWDSIGGDKIKNQGVANILVLYYGLGLFSVYEALKKFGYVPPYKSSSDIATNLTNSFKLSDDTIDFINKLDAEGKSPLLFNELTKITPKDKVYWLSKPYVLRTSEKIMLGVGVLFVGYLAYKFIKR
jgi:hypothetical protein